MQAQRTQDAVRHVMVQASRWQVQGKKDELQSTLAVGASKMAHLERQKVRWQAAVPAGQGVEGIDTRSEAESKRVETARLLQGSSVRQESQGRRAHLQTLQTLGAAGELSVHPECLCFFFPFVD